MHISTIPTALPSAVGGRKDLVAYVIQKQLIIPAFIVLFHYIFEIEEAEKHYCQACESGSPSHFCHRFREAYWKYGTIATGSPRFPMNGMDYGWGKPVDVQRGDSYDIGSMVLSCPNNGGKSIMVSTCLPQHQMDILYRLLSSRRVYLSDFGPSVNAEQMKRFGSSFPILGGFPICCVSSFVK